MLVECLLFLSFFFFFPICAHARRSLLLCFRRYFKRPKQQRKSVHRECEQEIQSDVAFGHSGDRQVESRFPKSSTREVTSFSRDDLRFSPHIDIICKPAPPPSNSNKAADARIRARELRIQSVRTNQQVTIISLSRYKHVAHFPRVVFRQASTTRRHYRAITNIVSHEIYKHNQYACFSF